MPQEQNPNSRLRFALPESRAATESKRRKAMVAGYQLVWTAYGWWLPNDPRGSWSPEIRVEKIMPLGDIHYGRRLNPPLPADVRHFYAQAQDVLKHLLLTFDDEAIGVIGAALRNVVQKHKYTCYACAVMPEHVHILIRRHKHHAEEMIEHFQEQSRNAMIASGKRNVTHPVWGGPGWKGCLNSREEFERTVEYIRKIPGKIGKPEQIWDFVKVYDGWMPGWRG